MWPDAGVREMAQSGEYFLQKREDLNSVARRKPREKQAWWHACVIPALEGGDKRIPGTRRITSLAPEGRCLKQ